MYEQQRATTLHDVLVRSSYMAVGTGGRVPLPIFCQPKKFKS